MLGNRKEAGRAADGGDFLVNVLVKKPGMLQRSNDTRMA